MNGPQHAMRSGVVHRGFTSSRAAQQHADKSAVVGIAYLDDQGRAGLAAFATMAVGLSCPNGQYRVEAQPPFLRPVGQVAV